VSFGRDICSTCRNQNRYHPICASSRLSSSPAIRMHATVLALGATLAAASPCKHHLTRQPLAETCNGTYTGVYSLDYNQDFFLGVPYTQAPINDLRFRNPKPLTSSWDGDRVADTYSPACVGYGPSQAGYDVSEDCLYLNIIRSSGVDAGADLPVAI